MTAPVRRIAVLVAGVLGLAAAWRALLPAIQVEPPTSANLAEERMQDFRDALYFPIREFLSGGNPYDPAAMFAHWPVRQDFNLYQPYHLVLHAPFALLDYKLGAIAFVLLSLVLLVVLAGLAASRVSTPFLLTTVVLAALLVFSQVGRAQLYVGQVNPLVALGAAAALLVRTTHPAWASVALALAWLKPQFGLPLAILLFARGSRRVVWTGTGIAAVASLPVVVLLVVRSGGVGGFLDVVTANLAHATSTDYGAVDSPSSQRVDLAAVLFRVTDWVAPAAEPLALVGVLTTTALLARRLDRGGHREVADLLTMLGVVVAVVHQPGDVLIAFPAAVVAAALWWRRRGEPGWWLLGVAVLAFAVPYAHLHAVDVVIESTLGARAAVTMDGVATVVCWAVVVALACTVGAQRKSRVAV